jgi:hypothetical protein
LRGSAGALENVLLLGVAGNFTGELFQLFCHRRTVSIALPAVGEGSHESKVMGVRRLVAARQTAVSVNHSHKAPVAVAAGRADREHAVVGTIGLSV